MIRYRYLFFLLLLCNTEAIFAQKALKWYDPSGERFSTLHNQLWHGDELKSYYDRLPAKAEKTVRKEVWNLAGNAAGLKIVFNTNTEEIAVRYTTTKNRTAYAMLHFPATGVSGIDLFAENADNSWSWANGSYRFGDTITYTFTGLKLDKVKYKDGRNFHLYLPLYNGVVQMEIGVPEGNTFRFIPPSAKKPIIVYGTSIAQGGCASRAGMAWTNILNRKLHTPVVNLGFSGNGKLEKEVIDLLVTQEAGVFILDCLPNLGAEVKNVKEKTFYAVNAIRKKYPNTPIVLVEQSHYTEGRLVASRVNTIGNINKLAYEAYSELQAKGIKMLYYLKRETIGLTMDDSVDGTHPTDVGMIKYAEAYAKIIRSILGETKDE